MDRYAIFLLTIMTFGCSATRPAHIGIVDGKLSPCPYSPNCVSSQSKDEKHFIEPFRYEGTKQQTMDRIISVLQGAKRCRIVTIRDNYIHAEFTSAFFRFVDDVEFYIESEAKIVHIRSASRIGNSDFGVNRKRLEKLRSLFNDSARNPVK
jgi:uncharacterized protein (DUF1499 family)